MTKLRFLGAKVKSLCWYPSEDASTFVLVLQSALTVALADALQCRGLCYSEPDGNANRPKKDQVHPAPRKWEGSISIPAEIATGDIALGDRSFPFSLAHKFKIGRDEKASDTDITLYVSLRVLIDGKEVLLYKFCQETLKEKFGMTITPAQGALSFGLTGEGDGEDEDEDQPEEAAAPGSLARKASMAKSGVQ